MSIWMHFEKYAVFFVYSHKTFDEKNDGFRFINASLVIHVNQGYNCIHFFRSTKHDFNISVHLLLFHSPFSVEPSFWLSQNLFPIFPMFTDRLSYFLLKFTIVFSQSFGEPFFELFGFGSGVDISRIKIRVYWYKGLHVISAERVQQTTQPIKWSVKPVSVTKRTWHHWISCVQCHLSCRKNSFIPHGTYGTWSAMYMKSSDVCYF